MRVDDGKSCSGIDKLKRNSMRNVLRKGVKEKEKKGVVPVINLLG